MGVGAGLSMYVVVVQKFTFAISSPDEFLLFTCPDFPQLAGSPKKRTFGMCGAGLSWSVGWMPRFQSISGIKSIEDEICEQSDFG